MPFQPAPNCAQFRVKFTCNGEPGEMVLHAERNSPFTDADMNDHVNIVLSWAKDNLRLLLSNAWTLTSVAGRGLSLPADVFQETPCTGTCTGAVSTENSFPSSVAAVVKHLTALTGRSFRGRTYVAGLDEGSVTGNSMTTTAKDNMSQSFDDLKDALESFDGDTQFVVLSRWENGLLRGEAIGTRILGSICNSLVGTQRRRLS